jgi:hypothetical protein
MGWPKGGRARCPVRRIGGPNLEHGYVGPLESARLRRSTEACASCPFVRTDQIR